MRRVVFGRGGGEDARSSTFDIRHGLAVSGFEMCVCACVYRYTLIRTYIARGGKKKIRRGGKGEKGGERGERREEESNISMKKRKTSKSCSSIDGGAGKQNTSSSREREKKGERERENRKSFLLAGRTTKDKDADDDDRQRDDGAGKEEFVGHAADQLLLVFGPLSLLLPLRG
jgi:hypothetical protein